MTSQIRIPAGFTGTVTGPATPTGRLDERCVAVDAYVTIIPASPACPTCGGLLEDAGPFDGREASSGVTCGHQGFGQTWECFATPGECHWFAEILGALVPPARILTVVDDGPECCAHCGLPVHVADDGRIVTDRAGDDHCAGDPHGGFHSYPAA